MVEKHSPPLAMLSTGTEELILPPPVGEAVSGTGRERLHAMAVEHYQFVWRVLRRLGLPPQAADDATQQVFLVAANRLGEIAEGSEKAFLYRSAALIALAARRTYVQRRELASEEVVDAAPDSAPGPEELAGRKQARALLDEALSSLDDDVREVFVLFELDGMPIAEIATLLDIRQGTCSSRLRRGREQFKEAAKRIRARRSDLGRTP